MPASEKLSGSIFAGPWSSHPVLLMVGASEESRLPLRRLVEGFGWHLFESASCAEGMALLRRERIRVVICEQDLPDGNWRSLLEEIAKLAYQPNLIVASRLADDRLWAEVLNLGAYDLLVLPYYAQEVRRVVSLAFDSKCREASGRTMARKPSRPAPTHQSAGRAVAAAHGD